MDSEKNETKALVMGMTTDITSQQNEIIRKAVDKYFGYKVEDYTTLINNLFITRRDEKEVLRCNGDDILVFEKLECSFQYMNGKTYLVWSRNYRFLI